MHVGLCGIFMGHFQMGANILDSLRPLLSGNRVANKEETNREFSQQSLLISAETNFHKVFFNNTKEG